MITLKERQLTKHFLERMEKRGITVGEVLACLETAPRRRGQRMAYICDSVRVVAALNGALLTVVRVGNRHKSGALLKKRKLLKCGNRSRMSRLKLMALSEEE